MALDWAHRGTHVAAVASQAIVRDHYRTQNLYRYVMGCSGGGDGTMTEAEMYPDDFDGHIAGASSAEYPGGPGSVWTAVGQRVNKVPGSWISPDEYVRIHEVLLKQYDGADGAIDGLIWDPRVIKIDRRQLSFLSEAKFGTLKLIADGIPDGKGGWLAPGFWARQRGPFPGIPRGPHAAALEDAAGATRRFYRFRYELQGSPRPTLQLPHDRSGFFRSRRGARGDKGGFEV